MVQGKTETEIRDAAQLFDEIQRVIESKQLAPILHTRVGSTRTECCSICRLLLSKIPRVLTRAVNAADTAYSCSKQTEPAAIGIRYIQSLNIPCMSAAPAVLHM